MNEPIVMGCSPSSGSTMLRSVLGRVPGLVTGGELGVLDRTHFFDADAATLRDRFEVWLRVFAARPFPAGKSALFKNVEDWGWSADELVDVGRNAGSWHAYLQTFFGEAVRRNGGRRWLEKTPGNVFAFHRTLEAFPDARFVHLVRDGRDVVDSLVRRSHTPFRAATRWLCAVAAAQELSSLPGFYELRYESLVQAPESELRRLCAFLGEPFDESALRDEEEAADATVESWTASHEGSITDRAVGIHRRGDPETVLAFLGGVRLLDGRSGLDLLREAGYDAEDAPRALTGVEKDAAEAELRAYVAWQEERAGACVYPIPVRVR